MTSDMQSSGDGLPRERRVLLGGSPNFRDAGGYRCHGGRLVWGSLFRSGHLADLSASDLGILQQLGLELVIDLRRRDEREQEPSRLPGEVATHYADITPGSQRSAIYADSTQLGGGAAMYDFMCEINREFVRSQTETFRAVFASLLNSRARRVLFHCSAGKDRTGFAVAMLQLALGVARADVEADYLLSRRYYLPEAHLEKIRRKYPVAHLSDEDLLPMMRSDIAYLHSALQAVEESYAGIDVYLREGLGLDQQALGELRRRLVEPA